MKDNEMGTTPGKKKFIQNICLEFLGKKTKWETWA
jgi:hypothetical protein